MIVLRLGDIFVTEEAAEAARPVGGNAGGTIERQGAEHA
jgi:hypothetical protein